MNISKLIVFSIVLLSFPAISQQSTSLVGKWSGVMSTQKGGEVSVELDVAETGGTWRMSMPGGKGRNNPCLERDIPVTIKSLSTAELSIDINGASVIKGCIDASASLRSTDGKHLQGSLTDGRRVSLSRK